MWRTPACNKHTRGLARGPALLRVSSSARAHPSQSRFRVECSSPAPLPGQGLPALHTAPVKHDPEVNAPDWSAALRYFGPGCRQVTRPEASDRAPGSAGSRTPSHTQEAAASPEVHPHSRAARHSPCVAGPCADGRLPRSPSRGGFRPEHTKKSPPLEGHTPAALEVSARPPEKGSQRRTVMRSRRRMARMPRWTRSP